MVHPCRKRFFVLPHDQIEMPFPGQTISIFDHRRDLVARVDMQQRKRDMAEKGLAGQPEQHGRIFPHRPEHGQIVEMLIGLPEDVDALVFKLTKMLHNRLP